MIATGQHWRLVSSLFLSAGAVQLVPGALMIRHNTINWVKSLGDLFVYVYSIYIYFISHMYIYVPFFTSYFASIYPSHRSELNFFVRPFPSMDVGQIRGGAFGILAHRRGEQSVWGLCSVFSAKTLCSRILEQTANWCGKMVSNPTALH